MLLYLINLGMLGSSSGGGPPLDLRHFDPEQTTSLVITSDLFDLDPEQTTLLS